MCDTTMRDSLAGLAMQALITSGLAFDGNHQPDICAKLAYEYADAMIKLAFDYKKQRWGTDGNWKNEDDINQTMNEQISEKFARQLIDDLFIESSINHWPPTVDIEQTIKDWIRLGYIKKDDKNL